MTVAELIAELQKMPQDMLLLIERGEWGPCEGKNPRVEPIHKYNADDEDWCIDYFPEIDNTDYFDTEVKGTAVIL